MGPTYILHALINYKYTSHSHSKSISNLGRIEQGYKLHGKSESEQG